MPEFCLTYLICLDMTEIFLSCHEMLIKTYFWSVLNHRIQKELHMSLKTLEKLKEVFNAMLTFCIFFLSLILHTVLFV